MHEQKRVEEFIETHDLSADAESRILDLTSEVGELAKEVLKATDYGTEELKFREEMRIELGDCLFALLSVAHELDINASDALDDVLEKYAQRLEKGGAGSAYES